MARGGRNRSDEVTEGNSAGPFMRGFFPPKLGVSGGRERYRLNFGTIEEVG